MPPLYTKKAALALDSIRNLETGGCFVPLEAFLWELENKSPRSVGAHVPKKGQRSDWHHIPGTNISQQYRRYTVSFRGAECSKSYHILFARHQALGSTVTVRVMEIT